MEARSEQKMTLLVNPLLNEVRLFSSVLYLLVCLLYEREKRQMKSLFLHSQVENFGIIYDKANLHLY